MDNDESDVRCQEADSFSHYLVFALAKWSGEQPVHHARIGVRISDPAAKCVDAVYLFCPLAKEGISIVAVPRVVKILDVLAYRCFVVWTSRCTLGRF
jgi:hypothetical protein